MSKAYTPVLLLLLAGVFGVLLFAACAPAGEDPNTITWRDDLADARADAAEKGRPLMVVFR